MLRLWPSTDQLTPRPRSERNPFDAMPSSTASGRPDLTHLAPSVPGAAAVPPTPQLFHAPQLKMQQPPPGRKDLSTMSSLSSSAAAHTSTSKGQIHVKLIQARSLNVHSIHARPYVVVQFEQNEFVSRDPTNETDKEVKGVATTLSRINSSNSIATLAPIESKLAETNRAKSANPSPSSSISSSKSSGIATGFFGRLSPHNPVWKHEVSLYAVYGPSLYNRLTNVNLAMSPLKTLSSPSQSMIDQSRISVF